MELDAVDGLIKVMSSTTDALSNMLTNAYTELEDLRNSNMRLEYENEELRKQIQHLQASINAEMGCEGTD